MINKNKKIKEITNKYGIRDIYVFGSEISGFTHPGSDVDIGVIFENGLPAAEKRMRVYGEIFSDISGVFSGKKLDLVFLQETPLHFQFKALTEGELLYSRKREEAFTYKEKIINMYRDYKYFIDEFYKGILESPAT